MDIFAGISLTLVIAAIIAGILQKLKQPLIIGHIITGLIIGPYLFQNLEFKEMIDSLSEFGIALLLFIIGLSLTPKVIKEVGKVSLVAGLGQILITTLAGFLVANFLGFPFLTSIYLAVALTFSSTIIIMKLLSDKRDLNKFYSKISIGLLLIQDLIVALLLIVISAFSNGVTDIYSLGMTILKGIIIFDLIILAAYYVLPMLESSFAKSQEFLFLFSIGWGLGLATLFHYLGFSMEIGALVAGVALSTSPYHFEISSRLRPLRDFFIILFFILLGSKISFSTIDKIWLPAVIFSVFVIVVKPLLVLLLTSLLGYKKKVNFLTAINFTQISEFSLVFLVFASTNGHISSEIISLITLVSLITITISSYIVLYGKNIYPIVQKFLPERSHVKSGRVHNEKFDVILFGCNRVGYDFIESFKEIGDKFLIVDYNPETIKNLEELGVNCRYGDAEDNEFIDELNLADAKMIISTIPSFDTNQFIIDSTRTENESAVIMVISHDVDEAIGLYEAGASYVITPHFLGGKYASMLITKYGFDVSKFIVEKEKHLKDLSKRKDLGSRLVLPELYH